MFGEHKKHIMICGVKVPVDTDFRLMCEYSGAIIKKDSNALAEIAERFFYAGLPDGVSPEAAAAAFDKFYSDGLSPDRDDKKRGNVSSAPKPCFDFSEDECYFVSAFLSNYGINLHTDELHWFLFCELFRGLPDETKIKQIMGIRSVSLSEISSGSEKKRIMRLKSIFALKSCREKRFVSVKDRNKAMIEDMQRRHEEIRKMKAGEV